MDAVEILGGREKVEAVLRDALEIPDFDISKTTQRDLWDLLLIHRLTIEDVFPVAKEDLEKWKQELNIRPETGGDDSIGMLSIVFDAFSQLCKPRDPPSPEYMEKIRELRKKYRIANPETELRGFDESQLAEVRGHSQFTSRYREAEIPGTKVGSRIADMDLQEGHDVALRHPIIGAVGWGEPNGPGSGYVLYHLQGPEQGKPLLADHAVLFDDQWRNVTGEWDEFDRLLRMKEGAVEQFDFEKAAQYRDQADALKKKLGRR